MGTNQTVRDIWVALPVGLVGTFGGDMAQPMYQQIADDLRRQIEAGTLEPGKQLPTELELREKYSASRNTVRDAIKRLAGLGLVESRPLHHRADPGPEDRIWRR